MITTMFTTEQIAAWLDSLPADADDRTEEFDAMMSHRAQLGAVAVAPASEDGEPQEQNLTDTLANILHWVDCHNANAGEDDRIDFEQSLASARSHHAAERSGLL